MTARVLVVNADDFGLSPGVNDGVVAAHEHGIVTSASLMVRGSAAEAAGAYAQSGTRLSVGLHFDVGEWRFDGDDWVPTYTVVDVDDPVAVQRELDDQLEAFGDLVGRRPTHLDSHQHVHRDDPVRTILSAAGWRLHIPVRDIIAGGIAYDGGFYGQDARGAPRPEAVTVDALVALIGAIGAGVTEIACHPAAVADVDTMYDDARVAEAAALCDPRAYDAVLDGGILLCGFADLASFLPQTEA